MVPVIIMVLTGVVFGAVGIKKGFYLMWGVLFNILVSIFLGVMLTPIIADQFPDDIKTNPYYLAGLVTAITALVFIGLHIVMIVYIMGVFKGTFPKILNYIGSGIFGFLSGCLICGIFFFVLTIIPESRPLFVRHNNDQEVLVPDAVMPVVKACNFIGVTSLQCYPDNGEKAIKWLITTEVKSSVKIDESDEIIDAQEDIEEVEKEVEEKKQVDN